MREKEVLKAIENHVNSQGNNWKFIMGREALDKKSFLKRLKNDKKFRKLIVDMVITLSIDILTRKGKAD